VVERLSTLLREEIASLDVPPPPAAAILGDGRRRRRRRRLTEAVAGVAALGLVAAGVGALVVRAGDTSAQEQFASARAAEAYDSYGAFSAGSTVYIGNHQVTFPEKVKALYYTSLGALVRTGKVARTDAAGPSHYTLVRPDGSTRDIDLRMGDRIAGTDPDSPNVAYAEPRDGYHGSRWDLVVVSLESGDVLGRTTVSGAFTWGGWEAPPVDLQGERMWAHLDAGWLEYDWMAGTTRMVPNTGSGVYEVAHGRYAVQGKRAWTVHDFGSGDQLTSMATTSGDYGLFSPDGRFLRFFSEGVDTMGDPTRSPRFLEVDTGKVTTLPDGDYGWTPDGHALRVDPRRDRITVCDPASTRCDVLDLKIGAGTVKLGGLPYES
jgi:hypothetical protein